MRFPSVGRIVRVTEDRVLENGSRRLSDLFKIVGERLDPQFD